jgi:protein pelota
MKVLKKDLKSRSGEIALMTDTLEDLWHLKYIVDPNDLVFALTKRKPEAIGDKIRPEKIEKVTTRLGIRVEKVEFHKFANRLRIQGIIEHGMDAGFYHTLNIEEGTNVSIVKEEWKSDQLERIREAEEAGKRPSVILVGIEEGDADIGLVRHYGIEPYSHIRQSSGKRENGLRDVFFKEIAEQLGFVYDEKAAIVVCGPGFTKDDFMIVLKKSYPEIASKAILEDSTMIGISGFLEVLKKGSIDKIMHESRLAREAEYMDQLLKEISVDGKVAYGFKEVREAIDFGAVGILLVADENLRKERENAGKSDLSVESMMKNVESSQGKIIIFSTEFEPGQKLHSLGGIAALLRYKLTK